MSKKHFKRLIKSASQSVPKEQGQQPQPDSYNEKQTRSHRTYGRPLPEAGAYTNNVPVQPLTPLQYSIPAGQSYPVQEKKTVNDYYHVLTFDRSSPGDGALVVGTEKYIPISYNHRQGFVKASDVKTL